MSLANEIAGVVAVLQSEPESETKTVLLGRWQARLAALREAPAGAGWEWLAARGDATAALARDFCAMGGVGGAEVQAQERPGS